MRKHIILVLCLLCMLTAVAQAQDIDVSSMDKTEMMQLLQAIMQKLEADSIPMGAEPEPTEMPVTPTEEPTPVYELPSFDIYENKKLIIGQMPSYYFINPTEVPESSDDAGSSGGTSKKHKTPEECENYCSYKVCEWGDNLCYFTCYYPCAGEPIPDWLQPYL